MLENEKMRESKKKSKKRPVTAPLRRPNTAGAPGGGRSSKDPSSGFQKTGDDAADVDKIITRIYNKQKENAHRYVCMCVCVYIYIYTLRSRSH